MIKINIIIYDETIDNEDVPETVGIMCINCGKRIGCSLENQKIEDFITPFVTNMMFQHIGLFWTIKSNKNLNFDFQNHCPSWIPNGPWYKIMICSQLHGLVFEYYFKDAKREIYNLMYSIEAHVKKTRNQSASTNLLMIRQLVVVADN